MPDLRRTGQKVDYISNLRALLTLARGLAQVFLVFATLGITVVGILIAQELARIPDLGFLKDYRPVDAISIYDRDNKLIETIDQGLPRTVISPKSIPDNVKWAVLAAEDKRFYQHHGVSPEGITRAMLANLSKLRLAEGGSTISQQLAKNLFFVDEKRTGIVKLAEMVVAYQIESRYSKEEILALYLTEIYFGNSARGIEQAAQKYFGHSASRLTVAEAAFLAGIIRAPSYLGSPQHRKEAIVRQHQVLDAMVEAGFLNQADELKAEATPLAFTDTARQNPRHIVPFKKYPYFISLVLDTVRKRFDNHEIGLNGIKIYTTLDQTAQTIAEQTLARQIRYAPPGIQEEALVALSIKDGSVLALVGGAHDFWKNQWNCAVNVHTAGSSLKPFIYLTAFTSGIATPESTVSDTPFTMEDENGKKWTPKNFDGKYMGEITIREALVQSRNMCTIRTLEQVGIANAINTIRQAGISTPIHPSLSLALGSPAVTPLELAGAYGAFARGGVSITPWFINRIEDARGRVLDINQPIMHRIFPQEQTAWMVDLLSEVVRRGTGTQARLSAAHPVAGKTGTADKAKDIWFVGFTPEIVTCVWGGGDEKSPIAGSHVTGGTVMAQVFRAFNTAYYKKFPAVAGAALPTSKYYSEKTPVKTDKPPSHSNDVPYWQIDSSAPMQQAAPQAVQVYSNVQKSHSERLQKGVTEYHWDN